MELVNTHVPDFTCLHEYHQEIILDAWKVRGFAIAHLPRIDYEHNEWYLGNVYQDLVYFPNVPTIVNATIVSFLCQNMTNARFGNAFVPYKCKGVRFVHDHGEISLGDSGVFSEYFTDIKGIFSTHHSVKRKPLVKFFFNRNNVCYHTRDRANLREFNQAVCNKFLGTTYETPFRVFSDIEVEFEDFFYGPGILHEDFEFLYNPTEGLYVMKHPYEQLDGDLEAWREIFFNTHGDYFIGLDDINCVSLEVVENQFIDHGLPRPLVNYVDETFRNKLQTLGAHFEVILNKSYQVYIMGSLTPLPLDFDGVAHRGAGDFGGPGYGLVQVCNIDGVVAAQGLFSFGVGASVVTVLPSCTRTTVAAWVGWRASPPSILPDAWKSAVKLL